MKAIFFALFIAVALGCSDTIKSCSTSRSGIVTQTKSDAIAMAQAVLNELASGVPALNRLNYYFGPFTNTKYNQVHGYFQDVLTKMQGPPCQTLRCGDGDCTPDVHPEIITPADKDGNVIYFCSDFFDLANGWYYSQPGVFLFSEIQWVDSNAVANIPEVSTPDDCHTLAYSQGAAATDALRNAWNYRFYAESVYYNIAV